jgi:hypothetical protein
MPPETPSFRGSWTASRPKKNAANPLILQPPKVKGVDLKQSAPKKQIFRAEPEKEPNVPTGTEIEEKTRVENEDSADFKIYEESPEDFISKEESSDHFFSKEESSEQIFIEEEKSEQEFVNEEERLNRKSYEYPLLGSKFDASNEKGVPDGSGPNPNPPESLGRLRREYGHQVHDVKVKLPVNLAHVDLDVDIFDTLKLSKPIGSVTSVEWSIHSINMDVIIPAAKFFSKGILLLDLEYVEYAGNNEPGTLHALKIHVPWSKIVEVDWILQPELSCNQSKEYMFTDNYGDDPTFHREFSERLVDKLDFQLTNLNCIWNEQLMDQERILIQGSANMQIDIYQKQCVDLRDLVGP